MIKNYKTIDLSLFTLLIVIMKKQLHKMNNQTSAIYGMAFIGALIYFIQHAHTFWQGALGLVKAIIWPAVLIYKLLEFLKV